MFTASLLAASLALTQSVPCSGDWVPGFGPTIGVEGPVNAMLDIGGETVVGGLFSLAGGLPVMNVARFDGQNWHPLGSALNSEVLALTVWGSPDAPRIFAGGAFQSLPGSLGAISSVAEFDGQEWFAPAGGFGGLTVDFEVLHDESGSSLWALNRAFSPEGSTLWRVGRYDSTSWESVSPLRPGTARRMVVNDDGSGPRVYVVGQNLVGADGIPRGILVWDGADWQMTGSNEPLGEITAVTSFDWGQGPRLTVVGQLPVATIATLSIARLEGTEWLHTPVTTLPFGTAYTIRGLAAAQLQPGGPVELFGVGRLNFSGQPPNSGMFRWEGGAFVNVIHGDGSGVRTLERVVSGSGDRLLLGGSALSFNGFTLRSVASFSSAGLDALGSGLRGAVRDTAQRITANGPELYLTGGPLSIGSKPLGEVARFANGQWSSLLELNGTAGAFQRLLVDELSPTQDLYAAGQVVRRYNGSFWAQLGDSFGTSRVTSMAFFEPEGGPRELYGLRRSFSSPSPWGPVWRYAGVAWQPVLLDVNGSVDALCVFDDGSGPALYVGGDFTQIEGQPANSLVRYDGSGWTEIGAGLSGPVKAIAVYDSGFGPQLHVTGPFLFADGQYVSRIARLDGGSWLPLGKGLLGDVQTLSVHTSPGGPLLVAAGVLLAPEAQTPTAVALWDGEHWTELPDEPLGGQVFTARSILWPGDLEPTLHLGGTFTNLGAANDSHFARWGCPQQAPLVNPIASCQPSDVGLTSSASFAPLGGTLPLSVSTAPTAEAALVLLGLPFTAGAGCGLPIPDLGELWLDPLQTIALIAVGAPTLGTFQLTLPVPTAPGFLGVEIALQAASLAGPTATLSNALFVVLGP